MERNVKDIQVQFTKDVADMASELSGCESIYSEQEMVDIKNDDGSILVPTKFMVCGKRIYIRAKLSLEIF